MLQLAPQTIKNNFADELRMLVGIDRFGSLRRYYDSLKKDIKKNAIHSLNYASISDRLDTTRYFYFPTESSAYSMNCFERSASLYLAFKELYPKSRPALVFTTDKNKTVHASVLFTHEDELWGADPSGNYFDKILLEPDAIIVPQKEGKARRFEFEEIKEADESLLEHMVKKLRTKPGIVDFFYESGQRVAYSTDGWYIHKSLFMKITPDNDIVSEIRIHGDGFPQDGSIRFTTNPFTGEHNTEFLRYKGESWGYLLNAQSEPLVSSSPFPDLKKPTDATYIHQLQDVSYYLTHGKNQNMPLDELTKFAEHKTVLGKFERIMDIAKRIDEPTYHELIKYLRFRYGQADKIEESWRTKNVDINSLSIQEIGQQLTQFGEELWETTNLQYVPAFLKFADDSKKYTAEISRQILSK